LPDVIIFLIVSRGTRFRGNRPRSRSCLIARQGASSLPGRVSNIHDLTIGTLTIAVIVSFFVNLVLGVITLLLFALALAFLVSGTPSEIKVHGSRRSIQDDGEGVGVLRGDFERSESTTSHTEFDTAPTIVIWRRG
jgi:hypothetical protein